MDERGSGIICQLGYVQNATQNTWVDVARQHAQSVEHQRKSTKRRHKYMGSTDPASLVGYCGLYCNACGIRQEKIKTAVNDLRGIIATYGFDKIMPELVKWEPSLKHYNEFDQVMNGLVKLFGDCPGCLQGGGDPNCKVRKCAKRRGSRTCAECEEAENCEPLAPYRKGYKGLTPALQNIKQNGIGRYAEEMQKKVNKGYSYLEENK